MRTALSSSVSDSRSTSGWTAVRVTLSFVGASVCVYEVECVCVLGGGGGGGGGEHAIHYYNTAHKYK